MTVIRKADLSVQQDADAIVALLNEYAEDETGGGESLSEFTQVNLVSELSKRPHYVGFLAYVDNVPAGLVNCFEVFSTFQCKSIMNIHDVMVSSAFRGQKLSKKLFAEVEAYALERGCCKLTLEVLEGNVIAKQAYEGMGYAGYELDPEMGNALFYEKSLEIKTQQI